MDISAKIYYSRKVIWHVCGVFLSFAKVYSQIFGHLELILQSDLSLENRLDAIVPALD